MEGGFGDLWISDWVFFFGGMGAIEEGRYGVWENDGVM